MENTSQSESLLTDKTQQENGESQKKCDESHSGQKRNQTSIFEENGQSNSNNKRIRTQSESESKSNQTQSDNNSNVQGNTESNPEEQSLHMSLQPIPRKWNHVDVKNFIRDIAGPPAAVAVQYVEIIPDQGSCIVSYTNPRLYHFTFHKLKGAICNGKKLVPQKAESMTRLRSNFIRPGIDTLNVRPLPVSWSVEEARQFISKIIGSELAGGIENMATNKGIAFMKFPNKRFCDLAAEKLSDACCEGNQLIVKQRVARRYTQKEEPEKIQNTSPITPPKWKERLIQEGKELTLNVARSIHNTERVVEENVVSNSLYNLNAQYLASLNIKPPLGKTIRVSNLDSSIDADKLTDIFSYAGEIVRIVMLNPQHGNEKNSAKIEFDHPVEAVQAISMFNDKRLNGEKIQVEMDPSHIEVIRKIPKGMASIGPGIGPKGTTMRNVRANVQMKVLKKNLLLEIKMLKEENENMKKELANIKRKITINSHMDNTLTSLNSTETSSVNASTNTFKQDTHSVNKPLSSQVSNKPTVAPLNLNHAYMIHQVPNNQYANHPMNPQVGGQSNQNPNLPSLSPQTLNQNTPTANCPPAPQQVGEIIPNPTYLSPVHPQFILNNQYPIYPFHMQPLPQIPELDPTQNLNIPLPHPQDPGYVPAIPQILYPNIQNIYPVPSNFQVQNSQMASSGSHPAVPQPGIPQPGVVQRGVPQPGIPQPVPLPVVPQPGVTHPVVTHPGIPRPGVPQPGVSRPGVPQPVVPPANVTQKKQIQDQAKTNPQQTTNSKGTPQISHSEPSQPSQKDTVVMKSNTLVFSNLPPSVSNHALNSKMSEIGEVVYSEVIGNGRALVRFKLDQVAERCISLFNQSKVDNKTITVEYM